MSLSLLNKGQAIISAGTHQGLLSTSRVSNGMLGMGTVVFAPLTPMAIMATGDGFGEYNGHSGDFQRLGTDLLLGAGLAATIGFGGKALGTRYAKGFMSLNNKVPARDAIKGVKSRVPSPSDLEAQFFNFSNFKRGQQSITSEDARSFAGKYLEQSYFTTNKNEFYNLASSRYNKKG